MDLQWVVFSLISFPAEFLLHSSHLLLFWVTVAAAALFISFSAAALVLLGTLLALLSSYGRRESPLPRYKGPFDALLGRSYRASTLTSSMPANNNVSIASFSGKTVIAYRKADTHFASPLARIVVATSTSMNLEEWTEVWYYHTGTDDLREVMLFRFGSKLFLYFACLAPFKRGFTPRQMQWTSTEDLLTWSVPVTVGRVSEITWDVKVREEHGRQVAYKTSYVGNHYAADAVCTVHFEKSLNGFEWEPVQDGADSAVYSGGICEVSFAFTSGGDLVAIGRNEDGDSTGFGSQLFFASKESLGTWTSLRVSLPYRFDSPRLVCIEEELFLFSRYARESYALVPHWLPFGLQRFGNLLMYSLLPKSAGVYRLRSPAKGVWSDRPLELVRSFEGTYGDTGFFSLAEDDSTGDWLVANYSSSCHSHAPWIYGQVFATDVWVCRCHIIKRG